MILLLLIWVGASTLFCLALLAAAARQVPAMDQPLAVVPEPDLLPERIVAFDNLRAASLPSCPDLPASSFYAGIAPPTTALADDPPGCLSVSPVCLPAENELSCPVSVA